MLFIHPWNRQTPQDRKEQIKPANRPVPHELTNSKQTPSPLQELDKRRHYHRRVRGSRLVRQKLRRHLQQPHQTKNRVPLRAPRRQRRRAHLPLIHRHLTAIHQHPAPPPTLLQINVRHERCPRRERVHQSHHETPRSGPAAPQRGVHIGEMEKGWRPQILLQTHTQQQIPSPRPK